jgi:hypothetical protein
VIDGLTQIEGVTMQSSFSLMLSNASDNIKAGICEHFEIDEFQIELWEEELLVPDLQTEERVMSFIQNMLAFGE